ncbi:unnamed protein product [Meganyctiphanes norvegica]|uniref:GRIP domain-containing protein n=1 Tax=Meganyctiphanes norvegica TaxID=48144 RepID=A0AAV2RMT1_MEGNR
MAEVECQVVLAAAQQTAPSQFACDDVQQVETLIQQNKELADRIRDYENEKQTDDKTIAMLEFNNEHNKQKLSSEESSRGGEVINMELSHKALVEKYSGIESEKADLERQLREGSKEIIDKITAETEETTQKLAAEKEEVIQQLTKANEELEERLSRETVELHAQYDEKQKSLLEQVDGLTEIKQGFEKQIKQIEKNNEEMHANISVVQLHRNEARAEAVCFKKEGDGLKEELTKLKEAKASLELELQGLKDANADLEEKLSAESAQVSSMSESIKTLENNLLNLQKQVEALKETNAQLTDNMHIAQKAKADTDKKHFEEKKQYTEKLSALEDQLTKTKEEQSTKASSVELIEVPVVEVALTQQSTNTVHSAAPPSGTSDELTGTKNLLKTTQEKLRLAEMLNSEVDEYRERIRSLESKMSSMEDNHRQQLHNLTLESERQIAKKCEEYQQTLTSAYDQQDSETHSLIKTHQTTLQEAQQQVKEKTNKMDDAHKENEAKLKEKDEELTKFIHQYEDQIASLQLQHEAHMKQVEATWRARAEKMVKQREGQLQEEMDGLSEEWNKERKSPETLNPSSSNQTEDPQELERLTQVAAAAFRSGSDSVELLKKQVSVQRHELDDVKVSHKSEMDEIKRLLELKQRSRRGVGGGVKMGCQLEEAAEFEYLKNILYQYMIGNETQTLSKVLCAVVKFSNEQQAEILEREDQRQNLLSNQNNNIPHSNGIHSNGTALHSNGTAPHSKGSVPHVHFMTNDDSKIL